MMVQISKAFRMIARNEMNICPDRKLNYFIQSLLFQLTELPFRLFIAVCPPFDYSEVFDPTKIPINII